MTDTLSQIATPTQSKQKLRVADFPTLADALHYAAAGETGFNYHDKRGDLSCALGYAELFQAAQRGAGRLLNAGLRAGDRVALVASTTPEFAIAFFACQLSGMVAVPVPSTVNLGGRAAYADYLTRLVAHCDAAALLYPQDIASFVADVHAQTRLKFCGLFTDLEERFDSTLPTGVTLQKPAASDAAYIQYTSGSTRFPRGAVMTHQAVMINIQGILGAGVALGSEDRFASWLPIYHDMGLVGKVLAAVAGQVSVDYLDTRAFAMRPRLWPTLISRNQATISFGAPFGYELCARRLRKDEGSRFDLSCWRVAGVGADMIRPEVLEQFSAALAGSNFSDRAFLPCYGMAEVGLGITFTPLSRGVRVEAVDRQRSEHEGIAEPIDVANKADSAEDTTHRFVSCGVPLPDFDIEVRNAQGEVLAEQHIGRIHLRSPSLMSGYYNDPEASAETLVDGWLDTGDLGYFSAGELILTGRAKEMVIINGRNIWPQDLEHLAEEQDNLRSGDALAFAVPAQDSSNGSDEQIVLMVQCRLTDERDRASLSSTLKSQAQQALSCDVEVVLVPAHSLPKTTSGKLARQRARNDFLASRQAHRSVY